MKKRFLGIICFIYLFIIAYVILNNTLKNYLAPQMQKYLIVSTIPLLLMGLVLCFNDKNIYKFKIIDLILLVPLIMLFAAGDGRLSSELASNRMNNFSSPEKTIKKETKTVKEPKEENEEAHENAEYDFSKVDFNVVDASYETLAMLMINEDKADILVGKTIRVRGFALTKVDYLPKKYFALGKYFVSCCSADAGFIGFFAEYDKNKIVKNTWYEIEGVLEKGKDVAGDTTMVIKVINIKEIDSSNEEQYVYACYAYDNGNCLELDKYQEYLK